MRFIILCTLVVVAATTDSTTTTNTKAMATNKIDVSENTQLFMKNVMAEVSLGNVTSIPAARTTTTGTVSRLAIATTSAR